MLNSPEKNPTKIMITTKIGATSNKKNFFILSEQRNKRKHGKLKNEVH